MGTMIRRGRLRAAGPDLSIAAIAAPRRRVRAPARASAVVDAWEPGALAGVVLVAVCFGLVELYSASTFMAQAEGLPSHFYAVRQLAGVAGGAVLAAAISRVDYRRLQPLAWPLLAVTLVMLIITILPWTESIAPRLNGARRWIRLGVTVQPSELAKIALIVWTAALAVKKQDRLNSLRKGLAPFLIVWAAILLPVALQPNFSAMMLLALLGALVLFAGGARIGHFILIGFVALPVLWKQVEGASYRLQRITAFLDPSADVTAGRYQVHQSLIAIGSGGINGVGFGESRQKFGFLPEPHNDFLFSMIGEEWGLIGVVFTVLIYAAFAVIGYRIARRATDLFGYLLAIGMTNLIVVSAALHMGVTLALLPTTGVMLPFMSYGRSGLLVCFVSVGVLMAVARTSAREGAR